MSELRERAFGEILAGLRKQQRLSQEQLALRLGVHRNTISLWERGAYLPDTLTSVLDLCQALSLNDDEMKCLLEARFGTLSVRPFRVFSLPRNVFFTGRERELGHLHNLLTADSPVTHVQALYGMVGIGKTQLALEYAYRYQDVYHDIFFVPASSYAEIAAACIKFIEDLSLPALHEPTQAVAAMQHWWAQHTHWLIILDGIEDLSLFSACVPAEHSGAILLTTCQQITEPLARPFMLEGLSAAESSSFLLRRTQGEPALQVDDLLIKDDLQYAREVAALLKGHPLALDQAGAYLLETRAHISAYKQLFLQHQYDLLQRRGTVPSLYHPLSVVASLIALGDKLQQRSQAAYEFLQFCALLAVDCIEMSALVKLIVENAYLLPGACLPAVINDPFQRNEIMASLHMYSLVSYQRNEHSVMVHPLVRIVWQHTAL